MSKKSLVRTAAVALVAVAGVAPAHAATMVERPAESPSITATGGTIPGADVMLNFSRKSGQ